MRHQSRSFRSQSYLNNNNKQNKQNQNIINNIKQTKPLKAKNSNVEFPNLDKKISVPQTNVSSIRSFIKVQLQPAVLKEQYSRQVADQYSSDILQHYCQQSTDSKQFLESHCITPTLRAKMVDWMIEVLSSYKMNEDSFFRAIKIMDKFLLKSAIKQQVKDLHLIGVAAMFSACKYEEIYPIKLETMYDRIARKKFKRNEILQKQTELLTALNFRMEEVNLFDMVKNLAFQIQLDIGEDQKKYRDEILLYLSKMSLFNYDLAQEDTKTLASAVYFIGLKTLEQVVSTLKPEERLQQISVLLQTPEEKIIQISRKVLDLAKNFSTVYPNLGNLKKFNKFEYKKKPSTIRML